LAPGLKKINPAIVADPRPNGGSMMRIHRDVRFAKDKSPYKTFVAAHFAHVSGKGEGTPGYYLRIEPGASMTGGGMWQPGAEALKKVRDRIAGEPQTWQRATSGVTVGRLCQFAGETLKRPPAGYDANGPYIEDIKRKDFAIAMPLTDAEVCRAEFRDLVLDKFRSAAPFLRFLSEAVGLD
jgi:uncharacterized protein (TIGR02453 family)